MAQAHQRRAAPDEQLLFPGHVRHLPRRQFQRGHVAREPRLVHGAGIEEVEGEVPAHLHAPVHAQMGDVGGVDRRETLPVRPRPCVYAVQHIRIGHGGQDKGKALPVQRGKAGVQSLPPPVAGVERQFVRTRFPRRQQDFRPVGAGDEARLRRLRARRGQRLCRIYAFFRRERGNARRRHSLQRRAAQGVDLRSGGKGRFVRIEVDGVQHIDRAAGLLQLFAHAGSVQRFVPRRLRLFADGFKHVLSIRDAQAHGFAHAQRQLRRQMRQAALMGIAFPRRAHLRRVHEAVNIAAHGDARTGAPLQLYRPLCIAPALRQRILRVHIAPENAERPHQRAHVVGPLGAHQFRVVHIAQVAAAEAAAVENLQKRLAVLRGNGLAVEGAAVDGRDHGHVFRPLQSPLDLEGADPGPLHGL